MKFLTFTLLLLGVVLYTQVYGKIEPKLWGVESYKQQLVHRQIVQKNGSFFKLWLNPKELQYLPTV